MAVDRVGGGSSSSTVASTHREESGWSASEARARGVRGGWRVGPVDARVGCGQACERLVEVVDEGVLEACEASLPGLASGAQAPWVDEELRELHLLTLTHPAGGEGRPPACGLLTPWPVAARLGDGALAGFEPLEPATLPEGCTLWVEGWSASGEPGPRREVQRLEDGTLRVTSMPSRGVQEEPFAALLPEEALLETGGTHTVERALGWTADLDVRHPVARGHYREFLASGEVPVTHRAGGVLRSGRVALFTDACSPALELRFLRDFALLDGARVESRQRVVEYDDCGVEVRSHTRLGGGRQLYATILVDTGGQQVRADHSLVLGPLSPDAAGVLAALFGQGDERPGRVHARLRLTDEQALHWRDLARARVCQLEGMSVARFEAQARTADMAHWGGSPQLISLALARTASEVADALVRLSPSAEGLVACLVRLGALLGERPAGSLALVPASAP